MEIDKKMEVEVDFQQIVEHAFSGILLVARNRTIHYFNATSLHLFECNEEDLYLRDFYTLIHPSFHDICKSRLNGVFQYGIAAEMMEQKLVSPYHVEIDVEIKATRYITKTGDMFAVIFFRDITKQKRAERLLAHSEKLNSIGLMSAGIAHEVKNPLTAVKGFIQLLKEENAHMYLNIIEIELNKALSTLSNLLHVSKPDLVDEPLLPINLLEEVEAIMFLFQEQLYSINVIKKYKDENIVIYGKRNLIIKTFFNLIKNAIEAIQENGEITIELSKKEENAHIYIKDNGVGIPENMIKMLGTPFYTTKTEGTGLGLTQVFTAIEEHKGQIHVHSHLGVGTQFYISLPLYTYSS